MSIERKRLGDYEIIGTIGGGAMGSVYEAVDTLGRKVAIKVNKHNDMTDRREAFKTEANNLNEMRHPAIVGGRHYFEIDQQQYIVMDFIDGLTLEDFARTGKLDVKRVLDWTEQLLDGLDFVHSRDLFHRDIKPANIMVRSGNLQKYGEVVLTDFGLATHTGTHFEFGLTVKYAAPEQLKRREERANNLKPGMFDARVDIYGLASTIYDIFIVMLKPASASSLERKMINKEILPPLNELYPEHIPMLISDVFERALDLDRERRWHSAKAMREALQVARNAKPDPPPLPTQAQISQMLWFGCSILGALLLVSILFTSPSLLLEVWLIVSTVFSLWSAYLSMRASSSLSSWVGLAQVAIAVVSAVALSRVAEIPVWVFVGPLCMAIGGLAAVWAFMRS